jgi:hypothetical protein
MTNTKIQTNEIRAKWSKLKEADLTNLRSHDELSALVEKPYHLDKSRADADVTAWMGDRIF